MKVVKSKPVVSKEVMEVNAEEMLPEVPLEKVINDALVKSNVTYQVIAALKEKYGSLRLKDINDKESYLEVKEARKEVRKVGIVTEKLCKKGREDAVAIQRKWLEKENEILKKIAEIEDPLNAEIERFDNEVERKEIEENKRKEGIYINRQSTLSKLGATYDNGSFVLNNISYEVDLIKNADEEMWTEIILPKYRKVFEEIEAVKVEEENKRKAELAEEKRKRAEFDQQQKKFKEEQELFAKQQKELQEQKDAHEKEQRVTQQRKEEEKKKQELDLLNSRLKQLPKITWNGITESYAYYDKIITRQSELLAMDEETFNTFRDSHIATVDADTKEANEKMAAELEKEKNAAIELAAQQEREKIAEEQRQAEIKKQQEAQRKQQELEASKDKEKYAAVVEYLKHFPNLVMTSNFYKGKMNEITEFINEL